MPQTPIACLQSRIRHVCVDNRRGDGMPRVLQDRSNRRAGPIVQIPCRVVLCSVVLCKGLDQELMIIEATANATQVDERARNERNVLLGAQLPHCTIKLSAVVLADWINQDLIRPMPGGLSHHINDSQKC